MESKRRLLRKTYFIASVCVISCLVQTWEWEVGDNDVREVTKEEEEEDSLHLLYVWCHSWTLTNGETLYVYESH